MTLYKGDSAPNLITVNIQNNTSMQIVKAVLQIGNIQKVFFNPAESIVVSLTKDETKKLQLSNKAYLAVFDANGNKKTCEGSLSFNAKSEVVTYE